MRRRPSFSSPTTPPSHCPCPPPPSPQPERIRAVTSLLEGARGAVRIEDVLPLFPDFVEIGAFRDAVCRCLLLAFGWLHGAALLA